MIAEPLSRCPQCHDFCVSRGIAIAQIAILACGYQFPALDYHSPNRNFTSLLCCSSFCECTLHPDFVSV